MAARVLSSESAEADDVATAVLLDIGAELAALVGVSDRVRGRLVGPPQPHRLGLAVELWAPKDSKPLA
jgi:hypothetical protein